MTFASPARVRAARARRCYRVRGADHRQSASAPLSAPARSARSCRITARQAGWPRRPLPDANEEDAIAPGAAGGAAPVPRRRETVPAPGVRSRAGPPRQAPRRDAQRCADLAQPLARALPRTPVLDRLSLKRHRVPRPPAIAGFPAQRPCEIEPVPDPALNRRRRLFDILGGSLLRVDVHGAEEFCGCGRQD
jgi:hypothetical protein